MRCSIFWIENVSFVILNKVKDLLRLYAGYLLLQEDPSFVGRQFEGKIS